MQQAKARRDFFTGCESRHNIIDEDIDNVLSSEGALPGGMKPETLKKMIGNPEIMAMLQNVKMQEAMKLMMAGGEKELEMPCVMTQK